MKKYVDKYWQIGLLLIVVVGGIAICSVTGPHFTDQTLIELLHFFNLR